MTKRNHPQPANLRTLSPIKNGVAVLDKEAIRNLAGYFDVLIQMDLATNQRNRVRRRGNEENADTNANINNPAKGGKPSDGKE